MISRVTKAGNIVMMGEEARPPHAGIQDVTIIHKWTSQVTTREDASMSVGDVCCTCKHGY